MKTKPKRSHRTRPLRRADADALSSMAAVYVGQRIHRTITDPFAKAMLGDGAPSAPSIKTEELPGEPITVICKLVKLLSFLATSDLPEKELREVAFKLTTAAALEATQIPIEDIDTLNRRLSECRVIADATLQNGSVPEIRTTCAVSGQVLRLAKLYHNEKTERTYLAERLQNQVAREQYQIDTINSLTQLTGTTNSRAALKQLRSWKQRFEGRVTSKSKARSG